jgi:hypothetical protein
MDARVKQAAEGIIQGLWGGSARVEAGSDDGLSGREYVHRVTVEGGTSEAPPTVILKEPRTADGAGYNPNRRGWPASTFLSEWAGLQLLTEVGGDAPVAPRFYGGDLAEGVFAMEDLGAGTRLDHALLGDDRQAAVDTLNALMVTLARMHTQTASSGVLYSELRASLGPVAARDLRHGMPTTRVERFADAARRVDFTPARGFYAEMQALRSRWNVATDALCYVHFDACPDNCHWVGDELRLLDFESGQLAPWGADAAYARIHFPTCWCANRLPEDVWRGAEDAYRQELACEWPAAAEDDVFAACIADACARWAFQAGMRGVLHAWDEDSEWGIAMHRQRAIMRFEMLADTCDEFALMPAIGETARRLGGRLQALWPDAEDMPLYPAFRATDAEGAG